MDLHINTLAVTDAGNAEQGLDINDADAAKFDKVLGDGRSDSDQGHLADLADLDHVVRNKTMAALDQFQGRLGFADTAVTGQQDTDPVDIHQDTVNGNAGSQAHIEPAQDLRHKRTGRLAGEKHGHSVFASDFHDDVIRVHTAGKNHHGDIQGKELFKSGSLRLFIHLLDIGMLHQTDQLDSSRCEMIKIARQFQCGAVDLSLPDLDPFRGDLGREVDQIHFFDDFINAYIRHTCAPDLLLNYICFYK